MAAALALLGLLTLAAEPRGEKDSFNSIAGLRNALTPIPQTDAFHAGNWWVASRLQR